jgi:LysR family transcriptional regulator, low CO2-responsive transcriptional regulator
MEINLHQLEIFLCIARERSFSKAAEKLRISQPSVSIQIKNLEDSLQVKLFERLGRRVYLTSEGAVVLEYARKLAEIVAGLQSEIKDIKGIRRGKLSAGCSRVPSATLVPLAVAQFKKQYPETEISIKTGRSHEVEQWILENEVDLGVIEGDPASGLIKKEPWYADEVVLVLPRGSPLLKNRHLSLKEILEEPFLLQAPGIRPTFIERVIAERGMIIKKPVTVGSREAVKAAIVGGYGVALLPQSVIDTELRAGLVKTKKVPELAVKYPVNVVFRKDKKLSNSSLAFLEILRKEGAHPPSLNHSPARHK